jgi:hypothetical protein
LRFRRILLFEENERWGCCTRIEASATALFLAFIIRQTDDEALLGIHIKKVFICVQNSLKIKGSFGLQLLYEYDMITLKTVCVSTDQTGSV